MDNNDETIQNIIEMTDNIEAAVESAVQPADEFALASERAHARMIESQLPSGANSLVNTLKGPRGIVRFKDDTVVEPLHSKSAALQEVQAAEMLQRKKREQYEQDRLFFEKHVLQKARSVSEIQEDYIKILHPHYREKFLGGIERYGTVAAALKYMKDTHGLKVRGDVLRRMTTLIPAFKQEIDDALDMYQAAIHMEMHRRAVEGVEKGVYHQGELVGYEKVYSDSLLAKMADTHNPEYKEAKQKEASRGNTINVQIIKDFHNYKETK